jgi:hypothetical protein
MNELQQQRRLKPPLRYKENKLNFKLTKFDYLYCCYGIQGDGDSTTTLLAAFGFERMLFGDGSAVVD